MIVRFYEDLATGRDVEKRKPTLLEGCIDSENTAKFLFICRIVRTFATFSGMRDSDESSSFSLYN